MCVCVFICAYLLHNYGSENLPLSTTLRKIIKTKEERRKERKRNGREDFVWFSCQKKKKKRRRSPSRRKECRDRIRPMGTVSSASEKDIAMMEEASTRKFDPEVRACGVTDGMAWGRCRSSCVRRGAGLRVVPERVRRLLVLALLVLALFFSLGAHRAWVSSAVVSFIPVSLLLVWHLRVACPIHHTTAC
ncbi:hypothetical protein F4778DRAFT_452051 [Xylariomycetidae sp. FL2044]|nr:hypothetical protein F4778DRAFT_452051 [Xylariomycetidae sp. FL2044]